jgi:hypothetical protein
MLPAKTTIYSNSLILERERGISVFEKKRKDEELTNWSSGTGSSWRWWWWWLDSPDKAMVRV